MEKKYFYRKHIRMMQKVLPTILGVLATIMAIGLLCLVAFMGDEANEIKLIIIIGGLAFILMLSIEAVFIWFFFRRFTKVAVTLTEEFIIYKNIKGEIKIPIDQIQKLKFPSIKYMGGWVKIVYPGGNIRLTVVLEKIGDFLKELKALLDKKEKQNTYDKKAIFKFYKTAEYADQSWARLYEIFVNLLLITLFNLTLAVGFYFLSGKLPVMLLLIGASMFLPMITWIIAEIFFMVRVGSKADESSFEIPPRDKAYEKKIFTTCSAIYGVLYLLISTVLLLWYR